MIKKILGIFKKKDPVCGMKEEKGKGMYCCNEWFCSKECRKEWNKRMKEAVEKYKNLPPCCRK
ncbi:hypothetical protein HYU06_02145 [Candidatus Woesearchaeota archaeon]|nr:hypothetical protein [Candidatus Woesearchaeota archaeon]